MALRDKADEIMKDKEDLDNVIDLMARKLDKRQELRDEQYEGEDTAWETMVDLSLQDHCEYIEDLLTINKGMVVELYDLKLEIADLKAALQYILKQLLIRKPL